VDFTVDSGGEIHYSNEWVKHEQLIKTLESKVERARAQLEVWEAALRTARQEANPDAEVEMLPQGKLYYGEQGTKINYVRQLLTNSGTTGITAAEMRKRARKDGIAVNAAFPYAVLKRLVERKEAKEAEGRFLPVKKVVSLKEQTGGDV